MQDSQGGRWGRLTLVVLLGLVGVVAAWTGLMTQPMTPSTSLVTSISDETGILGPVFHPGVILALGSNSSTTLLGGIGVYQKNPEFTLPVFASLQKRSGSISATNLTPLVSQEFWEGGVYAIGWNGTSWLVAGQAGWGGGYFGSLVAFNGYRAVNLTGLIRPYFLGGGIFALGWNGTAWLLGGNSSAGVGLVALSGSQVTDLSREVPAHNATGWIQVINWNGSGWLYGGQGVFGTIVGSRFVDLLPTSPFSGAGVYAAGWNGWEWVSGGGSGRIVTVKDNTVQSVPKLIPGLDQAVTLVFPLSTGWLIGGKGTGSDGGIAPELVYWNGGSGARSVTNLTPTIPTSFTGGEIQGGAMAPLFGDPVVLLVGEGAYDVATGHGLGSIAALALAGGSSLSVKAP